MTTGRVEYAPDYKSEKRKPKYPEMTERFKQLDQRHEQQRLEREVIRAAKALVALYADESRRDKGEELGDLIETVGALNKFESTHGIETKD